MAKDQERGPSLAELEEGLSIDEHALEEACMEQPELFYRVAKRLALEISKRDAAEQAVTEAEAIADANIRRDAEVSGEKITEPFVKNQKVLHRTVREANTKYLQIKETVGLLTALKESFQQRSYALNHLVDLQVTGYFGDPSNTSSQVKDVLARRNKAMAATARRAMNEERRG